MKIKLPDNTEIPYVKLTDARLDHVMKLQRETGWTMQEIGRQAELNDSVTMALAYFLGMLAVGRAVKWSKVVKMSLSSFGDVIPEDGDNPDDDEDSEAGKDPTASAATTTTQSGASPN